MSNPDQELIDMIAKATPQTPINDEHRERLRRQVLEAYDGRAADGAPQEPRNPLFKFTGASVMKIAASFALLTAVGIFAITALSPSKAIAFEDVAHEILSIQTASFEVTTTLHLPDGTTEPGDHHKMYAALPNLLRSEMVDGDTAVVDFENSRMLLINHEKKAALLLDDIVDLDGANMQTHFFGKIQEHLRQAERGNDFGDIKYEQLGEKQIDGARAVGFRVLNSAGAVGQDDVDAAADAEDDAQAEDEDLLWFDTLDIWADARTGLILELEITLNFDPEHGTKVTQSVKNFTYNQEMDPKLFALEAPEGYELMDIDAMFPAAGEPGDEENQANQWAAEVAQNIERNLDAIIDEINQQPSRDDVVDALRAYTQQADGRLPDTLDSGPMIDAMLEAWESNNPGKPLFRDDDTFGFTDEQLDQGMKTIVQASTYLATLQVTGGEYTYRGEGGRVDGPPTPVLWLKPAGAPAYTVIYSDLTVKDSDRGPDAP